MIKNLIIIAAALLISLAGLSSHCFASTTCEIISVDDTKITMDCGDDADDYESGMKVKIKESKKRKAIEGC